MKSKKARKAARQWLDKGAEVYYKIDEEAQLVILKVWYDDVWSTYYYGADKPKQNPEKPISIDRQQRCINCAYFEYCNTKPMRAGCDQFVMR